MATPRSPQHTERQHARVPKLSYRRPLTQDELDRINSAPRELVVQPKTINRTVSVRETIDRPTPSQVTYLPPRKKSSILSGFFSKEPTISALAQVEADLTAKHGAATPSSVPQVSSRRMPEHVPKVNSRWDGIPETLKMREREDKQRKRLSQQSHNASPQQYVRSRSSDDSLQDTFQHHQNRSRRDSDAASHTDSWHSRKEVSADPHRHESFSSAASSNASIDTRHRQTPSAKSQSLRSPSGNSLPEITSFFPHNHTQIQLSQGSRSANGARTQSTKTSQLRAEATSIEAIPEHSLSPAVTPRERSPVTPVYSVDRERSPRMAVPDNKSNGPPADKKLTARIKHVPIDAFLAGEAKPVELEDDDSDSMHRTNHPRRQPPAQQTNRAKVNVAGSMHTSKREPEAKSSKVVRSEAAPWETQEPAFSINAVSVPSKSRVPKALTVFK